MPRVTSRADVAPSARATPRGAARFELAGSLKTKMAEASDVVALPGGRFLVVGDRSNAAVVVSADGSRATLPLEGLKDGKSQLEGVAYDAAAHHLFVAREEKRELLRYEWDATKRAAPVLEKTYRLDVGGPSNKGIEGLAFLSAEVSPTGTPQLLLAKEGEPQELSLVDGSGQGALLPVKLEEEVLAVCHDFSALAVDPKTGHLFISSDESATVAQVQLARDGKKVRGQLVQSFPLRDAKGKALERVEGLAFNERGDLFVLTENTGELHQLKRR